MLFCKVPSLTHLRVIRCKCYISVLPKSDKFSERAKVAVLMGYSITQKVYILQDWCTNKLFVTRDVVLKETHSLLQTSQAQNQMLISLSRVYLIILMQQQKLMLTQIPILNHISHKRKLHHHIILIVFKKKTLTTFLAQMSHLHHLQKLPQEDHVESPNNLLGCQTMHHQGKEEEPNILW